MLGPLGIPEPSPAAAEVVPDIMLVPLAAFDRLGHRIGYGAGHYDHTFAHLRKTKDDPRHRACLCRAGNQGRSGTSRTTYALDYVLTEKRRVRFPEF